MKIMNNQSPATDCPLSGAYLIEASAGTGKTWTLTSIILRLLIEKGVMPQKIVATTFTKAAAKEIQERLHQRLSDFYEACVWLKKTTATDNLYAKNYNERQAVFDEQSSQVAALCDSANQHLLHQALDVHPKELDKLLKKSSLLLVTLDKLFVGTLDSLAQKWLAEFGGQMGDSDVRELIVSDDSLKRTIVHDILRQYTAKLYSKRQCLYDMLSKSNKAYLTDTDKTVKLIGNVFNFYTAPIDEPPAFDSLVDEFYLSLKQVVDKDYSAFKPYFNQEYNKAVGIKNSAITNNLYTLPAILTGLKQGIQVFDTLEQKQKDMLNRWASGNIDSSALFSKNAKDTGKTAWNALPLECLTAVGRLYLLYNKVNRQFTEQFAYYVGVRAKDHYKQYLDEQKQTTFTLQTVRLILALQGRQGESLARHIRHLYPIALIDEAQDVSGEQAKLIELVYLSYNAKQTLFKTNKDGTTVGKGFLLLVGDPKQAIYRFRGGDVANYNYIKSLGVDTRFTLTTNRRSHAGVIDSLNYWFGAGTPSTDSNERARLGEGIYYHHITAIKDNRMLSWQNQTPPNFVTGHPVDVLRLSADSDNDTLAATAWHIKKLLTSEQTITCIDEQGLKCQRAILPSDIAILVNTQKTLPKLKAHLDGYNIDSIYSKGGSLYQTPACHALLALFEASVSPTEDKLACVLTQLFRYTLDDSLNLLQDEVSRSQLMLYLTQFEKTWHRYGIAEALTKAFLKHPFTDNSVWGELACFVDSERWLTDYWQLFEELSAQKMHPYLLITHLSALMVQADDDKRLALPSDTGIKIMTMHGSKGLEFSIVYILEMEKAVYSHLDIIYPYSKDNERRLSPSQGLADADNDTYFIEHNLQEEIDEKKRLAYVALTRASEQVFIVLKDRKKNNGNNPLMNWLTTDGKSYGDVPPPHLKGKVGYVDMETLLANRSNLDDTPYNPPINTPVPRTYSDWHSAYQKSTFYGLSRTSFTSLYYQFDHQQGTKKELPLPDMPDYDESFEPMRALIDSDDDIRHTFMRGRKAGTFLHKVLEQAGGASKEKLAAVISDTAHKNGIESDLKQNIESLTEWLYQVGQIPFRASGISLAHIPDAHKKTELRFTLGIDTKVPLNLSALSAVFEQYSDRHISPFIQKPQVIYAYLSGEIDLVYEEKGKYYIVDYKSNWLGQGVAHYNDMAMSTAMNERSYWLQASLYQLALHRLLKLRIKDYMGNEEQYLGAVEYVFLRGVSTDNTVNGSLVWNVPISLIRALDELFG